MAEIVKSKGSRPEGPVRPLRHGRLTTRLVLLFAVSWLSASSPVRAQSVLLGPVARRIKAKIELDPRLPSGALRRDILALAPPGDRACSLALPLCVARDPAGSGHKNQTRYAEIPAITAQKPRRTAAPHDSLQVEHQMAAALSALETAYRRLVYAARLPAPERRWDPVSGSPAITWALVPNPEPLSVTIVPMPSRAFDSASVICRSGVANSTHAGGSANLTTQHGSPNGGTDAGSVDGGAFDPFERDAALCIGEAIAARLDPAESPRSRRAYAEALWWELGRPNLVDIADVAHANALPERAAIGRDELNEAATTALLLEYVEQTLGTPTPFGLVTGLFALSGRTERSKTARTLNEPDWLDVLRESLGDDRVDFAHRVNAFAAARAQLGSSSGPLSNLRWLGNFARVVPDWDLRVSTLPRRVASKRPVAPLGMVAIRVDIDVPTAELSLAVQVEWEGPVPFSWTIVKLDAENQEIGRLDVTFEPRVTNAEKRIVALDGVRSLLVLGVNLGGIDATHLLDPDHAPFEPHGCTLYVVRI